MPAPATAPVVSRRRELGDTSARSLLTTILGEYVLPDDGPVWTATLVTVLALCGVEEKSARQALARTAAEGWLSSERHGRRVCWHLTAPGRRLLVEGAERIYGFGSAHQEWDRRWLMLMVSVPESKRDLRHRLRTRLSWAGFGTPGPGVWISPHVAAEAEAKSILAELGIDRQAMSFVATYGALGQVQDMVAAAWQLTEVADRYDRFTEQFAELRPGSGDEVLSAQVRLVHEWRRFPFLDPQLPTELLPVKWSGTNATELFRAKHAEWQPAARRRWAELAAG
ncbi:MAG TPA: PaaX family transcriptional regulator C-terminal domain-containing protein [Pseudonocardiaceae bacterium]|jgi:phenylacetic acid degradation operon negative regulatory protein|nr:PaaX family transcriptional regulator C-terminal domain-containing protein [Pseudonocardiaceae bacterium]